MRIHVPEHIVAYPTHLHHMARRYGQNCMDGDNAGAVSSSGCYMRCPRVVRISRQRYNDEG
eukprot:745066-Pyramimonas_sp.AAC.1